MKSSTCSKVIEPGLSNGNCIALAHIVLANTPIALDTAKTTV